MIVKLSRHQLPHTQKNLSIHDIGNLIAILMFQFESIGTQEACCEVIKPYNALSKRSTLLSYEICMQEAQSETSGTYIPVHDAT